MNSWDVNKSVEAFTLCQNDTPFMRNGSFWLVAAVFNRLNGASEDGPASQKAYQASLNGWMSRKMVVGDVMSLKHHGHTVAEYTLGGPIGERVEEAEVFAKFEERVCQTTGELPSARGSARRGALLQLFRNGATHEQAARTSNQRTRTAGAAGAVA